MSYLVGKVVLDVVAGAPNNGLGEDNVATVKQLRVGRDIHPYVSAQAFRRWLRDSLPASEPVSPVVRSGSGQKQQAYTHGRPDRYLDDDLFGYMVAVKGDKTKTCQRDTVLATGTFVSVAPRRPERDFGTMSRGFAAGENPVLHGHEFYSAELAGDVLLDLARIGVFEIDGAGLKIALPEPAAKEAADNGAEPVAFRGCSALRLTIEERRRRAALLLRTLTAVRGGAKRSMHYGDRTPALILLAPVKGGINPFTRVLGVRGDRALFDAGVLRAEIEAWADELDGPVLLGWAPGFLGEQRERAQAELADLISAGSLLIDHPRVLFGALAEQIERGERDTWFEDPKA
ncbi:type I-B CRISPR-associated protein Cas7/Cst2/DevR [Nonomuraea cavernae]|uniref:Type I-B CRISPR-associated protein Cas7/Cst2/DevR n=1 Tax=Nonomuraea cavernae TaxID=2045107 RepID=A0A918DLR6_9ACTN|nr:type I-B CRISPR-associated protein Cas7/Cst2/DevR [Nonomuraea cavernae]MCA2186451.1 type I-B CRISPR-associated protein Cas7/Cst2/DevR [Nonomuraea cavernae]GGO71120.1 type I-B CRISPR-associated protein Cas7/Cst2/DevR [Nonomuraea cavernae]